MKKAPPYKPHRGKVALIAAANRGLSKVRCMAIGFPFSTALGAWDGFLVVCQRADVLGQCLPAPPDAPNWWRRQRVINFAEQGVLSAVDRWRHPEGLDDQHRVGAELHG